jgi:membrane fusion protein (multidrug efflux system)
MNNFHRRLTQDPPDPNFWTLCSRLAPSVRLSLISEGVKRIRPTLLRRGFNYILMKGNPIMSPQRDQYAANQNDATGRSGSLPDIKSKQAGRVRNLRVVIPLLLIIMGLITAFSFYLINKRDFISTDDAIIDANRVSVSARFLGRIQFLMADEGDSVHAGQNLVKLEDSDLLAQEAQSRASVQLARENITLSTVNLKRAEMDYARASAQYRDGVISKERFEHGQSEYEAAGAGAKIAAAQARTAEAQLGIIDTQLKNTAITSPMDGVISKRWVMPGDVVQAGQAIFSIYDLKNIWITANVEETKIDRLHVGHSVIIKVYAYPHQEFTGKVIQIGSNTASQFSLIPPNNASGNYTKITQRVPVKISIENHPGSGTVRLLPGMSVNIKVKVR